jgi:hypothetical protein
MMDVQKETVPFHAMRDDERLMIDDETGRPTAAEVTAGAILDAIQMGEPLCIPGALDVRVGRPASRTPDATGRAASAERPASAAPDLERREHEREGGGAPSERGAAKHESLFERLWHRL